MTNNPGTLNEKRQQALQRLRENRGKERSHDSTPHQSRVESVQLLINNYPTEEQLKEKLSVNEVIPALGEFEQLSRFAKVQEQVYEQEAAALEAIERLKTLLKVKNKSVSKTYLSTKTEANPDSSNSIYQNKHQLLQDALSTNFFQDTMHWLTSTNTPPNFSSTPIEEIETVYQQVRYRQQVLQTLLDETQKELSQIQLHLQNLKHCTQENSNNQ